MPPRRLAVGAALLGLLIGLRDARAEAVDNAVPPFRLTIPDGFQARPEQSRGDQILTFHRAGLHAGDVGVIIAVDRMRGTIGREKPSPAEMARMGNAGGTIETGHWRSFDIWQLRQTQDVAGHPVVFLLAQVPLKPEAIQVKVATDAANEAEARAILASLLATVDGETNWLTPRERGRDVGRGCARLGIPAALVVLLVFVFVRRARKRDERTHP